MGNKQLGIPEDLALYLRDCLGIKTFVETGMYKAQTTLWAARHFTDVTTIEAWEKHYNGAVASYAQQYPNIHFVLGDSRTKLWEVIRTKTEPILFWLDAHWIGDSRIAHEQHDECPLAEELDAINEHYLADQFAILIDDARLFLKPPPYPHHPDQWLTYDEVVKKLMVFDRVVTVKDDVIIAIPFAYRQVLHEFYSGK